MLKLPFAFRCLLESLCQTSYYNKIVITILSINIPLFLFLGLINFILTFFNFHYFWNSQNYNSKLQQLLMQHSEPRVQSDKKSFDSAQHKDIDSRWVQLKFGNNFAPRSYFASCIQAGNIYIHGGFNAQTGIMKDFMVSCLHQSPSTWRTLNAKNAKTCNPGPLRNHTINSYFSQLILVGGQKNVVQNNNKIYRYDLLSNNWSICKCIDEKGRAFQYALDSHSAIIHNNFMYLIGGYDSKSTEYLNAIVKIDLSKISEDLLIYTVIKGENGPFGRANSSCCLVKNQIYLFGGGNMQDVFDDLWTFDIESQNWLEARRIPENITWPDKRKGATLVWHQQSNNMFLFGGIKKITKQQNDINVYMLDKKRWIKIHSNTNQLYDPSPTVKEQIESPSIYESKQKKQKSKTYQGAGSFNLSMKPVDQSQSFNRFNQTGFQHLKKEPSLNKQAIQTTLGDFKRRMSVVQQKKYRQFLNRKKKLLHNIQSGFDVTKPKRKHSPTSEALAFSLNSMGEQTRNERSQLNLPKVIYDKEKGQVIGKKPCARDGHAGLIHQQSMIILGGDRHMVSFNDAYLFKMNKGVESLPHYG